MSDARARAVERAHRLADDPVADEARRIAEHLRAGGRDPRLDPAADDVVQERQRVCVHAGARVVLRTWRTSGKSRPGGRRAAAPVDTPSLPALGQDAETALIARWWAECASAMRRYTLDLELQAQFLAADDAQRPVRAKRARG